MSPQTERSLRNDLNATKFRVRPDWPKRIAAAKQLGDLQAVDAVDDLQEIIQKNENEVMSLTAIHSLGQIGGREGVRALERLLSGDLRNVYFPQLVDAAIAISSEQAIEMLIDSWSQANPQQATAIQSKLVPLGAERVARPLIAGMEHDSISVIANSKQTLQQLGDVTPYLIEALGSKDASERQVASRLLAEQGAQAIPPLLDALNSDDERVRNAAAETLAAIGEPAVEGLIAVATDPDSKGREAAGRALVKIGKPAVRPLILVAANSPQAVVLLEQMDTTVQQTLANPTPEDTQILKVAFNIPVQHVQKSAALGLAQMGPEGRTELIEALGMDDEERAKIAGTALVKVGEEAVEGLIAVLAKPHNKGKAAAERALVQIGEPAARPLILAAVDNELAVSLLEQMKVAVRKTLANPAPGDAGVLKKAFGIPVPHVQESAALGLAQMGTEGRAELIRVLGMDDKERAEIAGAALVEVGEEVVPDLAQLLAGDDEILRERASGLLQQIGEPAASALIDLLAHESGEIRNTVVDLLIEIGGPLVNSLAMMLLEWQKMEAPPRALLVDPNGSGDYTSLVEAVASASQSAMIILAAGVHHLEELLLLDKGITLLGKGKDKTSVVSENERCVVRVWGEGAFTIVGITFEHQGDKWASVLEVDGKDMDVQIVGCRFAGGVAVDWDTIEDLPIGRPNRPLKREDGLMVRPGEEQRHGSGIWMSGSGKGRIQDCEFLNNGMDGLSIEYLSEIALQNNLVESNAANGISLSGMTRSILRGNQCYKNGEKGISVTIEATAEIEGNHCNANGDLGISYNVGSSETVSGTVIGNTCSGGGMQKQGILISGKGAREVHSNECNGNLAYGIVVRVGAQPILKSNSCSNNGKSGIILFDDTSVQIIENTCHENGVHGIEIAHFAIAQISGNQCEKNKNCGLLLTAIDLQDDGEIRVQNNTFNRNGSGIGVGSMCIPIIEDNYCLQNERNGLSYSSDSGGSAKGNRCSYNGVGILIAENASPTLEANRCEGNQGHAITYSGNSAGNSVHNVCISNGHIGLKIGDQARPNLIGNLCQSNSSSGIVYFGQAAGKCLKNRCTSNQGNGIQISDKASPTIQENTCDGNGTDGIITFDAASARIIGNMCTGNKVGIRHTSFGHVQARGNRSWGNREQDVIDWNGMLSA